MVMIPVIARADRGDTMADMATGPSRMGARDISTTVKAIPGMVVVVGGRRVAALA